MSENTFLRDPKGRIHEVRKPELVEIYRSKGWRILHNRPGLSAEAINNLNAEINLKLMEENKNEE